jgi:hypothetical protein
MQLERKNFALLPLLDGELLGALNILSEENDHADQNV